LITVVITTSCYQRLMNIVPNAILVIKA
jgi:hypothetical protein